MRVLREVRLLRALERLRWLKTGRRSSVREGAAVRREYGVCADDEGALAPVNGKNDMRRMKILILYRDAIIFKINVSNFLDKY